MSRSVTVRAPSRYASSTGYSTTSEVAVDVQVRLYESDSRVLGDLRALGV
jgi:hypothetical protein